MPNDLIQLHDVETGEIVIREMTDEEQAQLDLSRALSAQEKIEREEKEATLRANKIAAYQKLGLTDEEIEALMPTPKTEEERALIQNQNI